MPPPAWSPRHGLYLTKLSYYCLHLPACLRPPVLRCLRFARLSLPLSKASKASKALKDPRPLPHAADFFPQVDPFSPAWPLRARNGLEPANIKRTRALGSPSHRYKHPCAPRPRTSKEPRISSSPLGRTLLRPATLDLLLCYLPTYLAPPFQQNSTIALLPSSCGCIYSLLLLYFCCQRVCDRRLVESPSRYL